MGLAAARGGRPPPGGDGERASRFQHRTEHGVPGLAGLLGARKYNEPDRDPGWLINRDINATPTAGGRPDLAEARVRGDGGQRGADGE